LGGLDGDPSLIFSNNGDGSFSGVTNLSDGSFSGVTNLTSVQAGQFLSVDYPDL